MSVPLAPELDGLLLDNLGDLEAAFKRLRHVERAVFAEVDATVEAWMRAQKSAPWEGDTAYFDNELTFYPKSWLHTGDKAQTCDAWFELEFGAGDNGDDLLDDALSLTRLCRLGDGQLVFGLTQQILKVPAWKKHLKAHADALHPFGFRLDDVGHLCIDVQLDNATLAQGARDGDYGEAMGPLRAVLDQIAAAEPQLSRMINAAREMN
ncbi:MAG: hypothetical protein Q8R71_01255 [Phenylobacterium sp.]|nr:hypothetical protein [Phenylobacterium sp.]